MDLSIHLKQVGIIGNHSFLLQENATESLESSQERDTREFCTPTKSVRITSTQNSESNATRNNYIGLGVALLKIHRTSVETTNLTNRRSEILSCS